MNKNKTIGILGGMGPVASSTLYQRIIEYSQYEYKAMQDNEYPPVLLNSITLDGFDETGITDNKLVLEQLLLGVRDLERGGADFIIVACNTVHYFFKELQDAVNIQLFNIIDQARKDVVKHGFSRVGLFSSEYTQRLRLYQHLFTGSDIDVIVATPVQQRVLNEVIKNVMGGRQGLTDVFKLKEVLRDFTGQGAEGIVLGCTELPLALNQSHTDVKLFDTLEIIARAAVDYSLSK